MSTDSGFRKTLDEQGGGMPAICRLFLLIFLLKSLPTGQLTILSGGEYNGDNILL